jgi:hypothetical protein
VDAFSKHLIEAHLDYLRRLPGHTALIADAAVGRRAAGGGGELLEEWSALHGAPLPPAGDSWEWRLAPSPEIERGVDLFTTVFAYPDWKKACEDGDGGGLPDSPRP